MKRRDLFVLIPNGLSLVRLALGLAFPFSPESWRIGVVAVAAVTDAVDGFLARVLHGESETGRLLDPIADKVFVLMLMGTLLVEGAIHPLWAMGIAARDLVVLAGVAGVALRRQWTNFQRMRPTWLGKGTTVGQFAVLLVAVTWGSVPVAILIIAAGLSVAAAIDYGLAFLRHSMGTSRENVKPDR